MRGVIQEQLGPVSYTVLLKDGRIWKRHIDHLKIALPEEHTMEEIQAEHSKIELNTIDKRQSTRVTSKPYRMGLMINDYYMIVITIKIIYVIM